VARFGRFLKGFFHSGLLLTHIHFLTSPSQALNAPYVLFDLGLRIEKEFENFRILSSGGRSCRDIRASRIHSINRRVYNLGLFCVYAYGSCVMNVVTMMIDKRRRIEELWEKLRGTKTNTSECKTIVNEIGVLSIQYHQLIDSEKPTSQTELLRRNKST
jgi:hypothetical protein